MDASTVIEIVRRLAPASSIEAAPSIDMPAVYVGREHLVDVARILRDDPALGFEFLADVTAVDYLPAEPRYEVVYHLASIGSAPKRLRMKVRVPGADASLPTITAVWPAAGWPEREVFDLFGLTFEGHADLRRILLPEDWTGHPLRKDSAVQVRKDTASWSPIQLSPEEFAANVRAAHDQARQRTGADKSGG